MKENLIKLTETIPLPEKEEEINELDTSSLKDNINVCFRDVKDVISREGNKNNKIFEDISKYLLKISEDNSVFATNLDF